MERDALHAAGIGGDEGHAVGLGDEQRVAHDGGGLVGAVHLHRPARGDVLQGMGLVVLHLQLQVIVRRLPQRPLVGARLGQLDFLGGGAQHLECGDMSNGGG